METLKLIVKQTILQFKTLFNSPIQLVLILLIPFMITTTLPIFFFGVKDSYGIIVTLSVSIVVFILYSYFVGEYRKSTLYQNQQSTKSNKWSFNIASFSTIFIIGITVFLFHFLLMFIYSKLNWLQDSIFHKINSITIIKMELIPPIWTLYWVSIVITTSFSISFALYRMINEAKTYYIIIITIIILGVIFDATFNNYFASEQGYTDSEGFHWLDSLFYQGSVKALFPSSFYWTSIAYPFYAPSQMLNASGMRAIAYASNGTTQFYNLTYWKWQVASDYILIGLQPNAWRWNLLYFLPYIHSFIWISIGVFVSKLKKK